MPQIPRFEIAIADRSGNAVGLLGAEAEGLTTSTIMPGGLLSARFRVKRTVKLDYPDLQYLYDARISDSEGVFWRGRLDRWRGVFEPRSEYIEITAVQANADDQIYDTKTFTSGTAIETCVSTVLSDLMPKVTTSSLAATSRTLNANLTVTAKRAREVLALLASFGNSSNAALQWGVWPDGANAAYQLVLEARPTTPAYFVDLADINLTLGFDGAAYANKQRVLYNSGASWASATDSAAVTTMGLTREAPVIEAPDVTDATDAGRIASTAVALKAVLRVTAETGTISNPWAVLDANRMPVALHRVRAGKVLGISGILPSGQGGAYSFDRNALYIAGTEYDAESHTLTLTFEGFGTTLEGMMARLMRRSQI